MFSRLRSFLYRHRRKFFITGFLVGGSFILSRLIQRALREWQERETKSLFERTRKQQHYESIERNCNNTAHKISATIRDRIGRSVDTNTLIKELKENSSNKIALWERLKILAFTKLVTLIYVTSMVMVTLRVQLSLIGGYMYKDNAEGTEKKVTASMQEEYLNIPVHLLEKGVGKVADLVTEKVELLLAEKSLKEKLTIQDLEQLLWSIHAAITNDARNPCSTFSGYVLSGNLKRDSSTDVYKCILLETQELLETAEISSLLTSCISRGFTFVMDNLSQFYASMAKPSAANGFDLSNEDDCSLIDLSQVSIPLAKLIPIVNGLSATQSSGSEDVFNDWMQQLILMDNLRAMGANVYETFSV